MSLPTLHVMISPPPPGYPGYGWTARLLNNEPNGVGFSAVGPTPVGLAEKLRKMAEQHVELNGPRAISEYQPCPCGSGKNLLRCHGATPTITPSGG